MIDFDVDLVVPFVDNTDPVWQNTYRQYCIQKKYDILLEAMNDSRFDNPGYFEYNLKLIKKNMPWLRRIYLIVSNLEQIPLNMDMEKIVVIYHTDIIPDCFLPTFNSTTIEMFISSIPGLAEHFIYINDDMYPVDRLEKSDFFTDDGNLKINFLTGNLQTNRKQFRKVCANCYSHVAELFNEEFDGSHYLRPSHFMTPMLLSDCKECITSVWPEVFPGIGPFRTEYQHNQYIYSIFSRFKGHTVQNDIKCLYLSLSASTDEIVNAIESKQYQIICLNDAKGAERSEKRAAKIKEAFQKLL